MMSFDKTRVRILIVDDEESIRTVIGLALKEDGWTVDMVSNGKLGLEALTQKPYHIVMSDIQMPEMTGIEFLEAAKQKFPNTEFLVMTSNASLETAMQAIKLGAYDYLTKPFEDVSVISKKMGQVSEKILLRQQNNELLKRLKKASQDLKSLFDFGSQLNGLLDEKSLHEAVKTWIPKIFQDSTVSSFWFQNKSEKWELVQQSSEKISFEAGRTFESVEAIRTELSSLRSVRELSLKYENETSRLFIFEGLSPELADLFSQELQVCFEKVMRHQDVVSLASRDGLTRLYNHRFFQDRLRGEMSLVKRQSSDLSVILVDVDHFKKFNDTYGHPA
ncbi:MAG: response regulator receiver modulated diguanylate cyclase, partial [Bacteriovoracaceae bacterium]|nr:response regulator receiver modulated diguanylate cyclase [Bacteriovoracaceae bacterium]